MNRRSNSAATLPRLSLRAAAALAAVLACAAASAARGFAATPPRPSARAVRPASPGRPPAPGSIAAVEGIPITQDQFDRLAKPYFEEIHAKINRELTPEETALLRKNVLEELIR